MNSAIELRWSQISKTINPKITVFWSFLVNLIFVELKFEKFFAFLRKVWMKNCFFFWIIGLTEWRLLLFFYIIIYLESFFVILHLLLCSGLLYLWHTKKLKVTSWNENRVILFTINLWTNDWFHWHMGRSEWFRRHLAFSSILWSWLRTDFCHQNYLAFVRNGIRRLWTIWKIRTGSNGYVSESCLFWLSDDVLFIGIVIIF